MIASRRFPGRALVVTFVELRLVLPPAVAGIALLATFERLRAARRYLRGARHLDQLQEAAVVLAVTYVVSPFYVGLAIPSLQALDPVFLDASRTLGAGSASPSFASPSRWRAEGSRPAPPSPSPAGRCRCDDHVFGGSLQGVTQTLLLAIYALLDLNFEIVLALGVLLVLVSAAILLTVKLLPARTRRNPRTLLLLPSACSRL